MRRRVLAWMCIWVAAAACGRRKDDGDTTAPLFDGIQTLEILDVGKVQLSWNATTDPSGVFYDIHHATTSGGESFAVQDALASVANQTSVVIDGLHPGAGLEHFFVVRARDGAGNIDQNTKELSALFQANGIEVLGQYAMDVAADLAVDDARGLAFVSGWVNEDVYIIDVSDRQNPALITTINNLGYGADVQIKGNLLYLSHEFAGRGYDVYDTTNPAAPNLLAQIGPDTGYPPNLDDCHNVWPQPDRDLLFCASTTTGELVVLSEGDTGMGTPQNPVYLTALSSPTPGDYGVHDMFAVGNRLYASFLDSGIAIYDTTDPANPALLGEKQYSQNFTHNMWTNADETLLLTTDEVPGGDLKIWDISNLPDIQLLGEYQSNPLAIIHNVEVVGDYAYVSYYVEGLRVVDITDPTNPIEVGADDFYDGPDTAGFEGAWGVDPHPPYVYASGIGSGLHIYKFTAPPIGPPAREPARE